MSETTKLFWGSALIAAGFGLATLFGPPDLDSTQYLPTVLAYDGVPVPEPREPGETAGGRATRRALPLRAASESAGVNPFEANRAPSRFTPEDTASPILNPVWTHPNKQPEWLAPVPEVEPTSLVIRAVDATSEARTLSGLPTSDNRWAANDSAGIQLASAEQDLSFTTPATPQRGQFAWHGMEPATAPVAPPGPLPAVGAVASPPTTSHFQYSAEASAPGSATASEPPGSSAGRPAYNTWDWQGASTLEPAFASHTWDATGPGLAGGASRGFDTGDDPTDGSQVHIVVDGDSLPKLAARYLHAAERAWEIYKLNREVLPSPELLPIGVVLKLPPRHGLPMEPREQSVVVGNSGGLSPFSAPTVPGIHSISTTGMPSTDPTMVPVRPIHEAPPRAPEAQLMRPRPVDWSRQQPGQPANGGNLLRGSIMSIPRE